MAAYITSAYWFTSSKTFANPAVTLARSATDPLAGIRPSDALGFIAAQLLGAAAAALVFCWLSPAAPRDATVAGTVAPSDFVGIRRYRHWSKHMTDLSTTLPNIHAAQLDTPTLEKFAPVGNDELATRIHQFQFRDIRPKAASEIADLASASRLLGHTNKQITDKVYRRIGEAVKPTK